MGPFPVVLFIPLALCLGGLPEERMTTSQIVDFYGYPIEEFESQTEDGYILKLQRIPFGKTPRGLSTSSKPVVFFQHGFIASSADWVTNLPHQSAAFVFADAGFDVWMGNVRGNVYSRGHVNKTKHFWEFSWDEFAKYDLPAMIDTVLNITGDDSLYYIGHSQGTEIMFAKLAEDPGFGKKFIFLIKKFFALAPVATVSNLHGFLSYMGRFFGKDISKFFEFFGSYEFLPNNFLTKLFAEITCGWKFTNPLCDNVLFQIGGPESNQFNTTRLMVYMKHTPAGTSTQNFVHWVQLTQTNRTLKYDYGSAAENEKHYGQPTPPEYDLTRVQTPVYLYYSPSDWIADENDVKTAILDKIHPQYLKRVKPMEDFNHFDFIWGLNARKLVYDEIIKTCMGHYIRTKNHF
ncbi:unnamed protein product [Bursaphelenchus xylophilus]|uniref:Lipase n=1 Tax=Bursaphelenchus xylophilus TaxID=6326 RepID=A0A1I7RNQ0_BURXY|nr:unnamed protein product [Bursaphelenchus xylophilus]CAG9124212.1 unnamed protein product [Bursaphelenchus xylophilus]